MSQTDTLNYPKRPSPPSQPRYQPLGSSTTEDDDDDILHQHHLHQHHPQNPAFTSIPATTAADTELSVDNILLDRPQDSRDYEDYHDDDHDRDPDDNEDDDGDEGNSSSKFSAGGGSSSAGGVASLRRGSGSHASGSSIHRLRQSASSSSSSPRRGGAGGGTNTNNENGPAGGLIVRSRSNSFEMGSDWDVDDMDDEAGLRRYHVELPQHHPSRMNAPGGGYRGGDMHSSVPLPVEFTGAGRSLPARLWYSFAQLRIAARQRRAARLLTMPSESFQHKLYACLVTWCCDATDRGIMLVACCIALWLLIGWAMNVRSTAYWMGGIAAFLVRVSARRATERIVGSCNNAATKRRNSSIHALQRRSFVDHPADRHHHHIHDEENNRMIGPEEESGAGVGVGGFVGAGRDLSHVDPMNSHSNHSSTRIT